MEREIPLVSTKSFSKIYQTPLKERVTYISEVYLFVDEFSNYLDAHIAQDSYELLEKLGYKVHVVDTLDSARALISKGFLKEAKKAVNFNLDFLKEKISSETPLLGIEPSAILGFRDEYLRLADDIDTAGKISRSAYLVEEFLAEEFKKGHFKVDSFTSEEKKIKIHVALATPINQQKTIPNMPALNTPWRPRSRLHATDTGVDQEKFLERRAATTRRWAVRAL